MKIPDTIWQVELLPPHTPQASGRFSEPTIPSQPIVYVEIERERENVRKKKETKGINDATNGHKSENSPHCVVGKTVISPQRPLFVMFHDNLYKIDWMKATWAQFRWNLLYIFILMTALTHAQRLVVPSLVNVLHSNDGRKPRDNFD